MTNTLLKVIFCWIILQIRDVSTQQEAMNGRIVEQFSCSFETDYCLWTNDTRAEFDWIRNKGRTASDETGPPWDHTTEDANTGYYLYIESSLPRKNGDRARIISPVLDSPGIHCLKFWHHMHGNEVRELNVYTREVRSRKTAMISHLLGPWSNEGTLHLRSFGGSGAWWNVHEVELLSSFPIQIIIEGVRGENYRGDIAIDDVTLKEGLCESKLPDCDFESNTCGWTQMARDEFNWLPNKGETHTRYTGPSIDHTLGTAEGRYLYIESSWPRNEGDRAWLLSPPISCLQNAQPIFHFWFYMSGSTLGPLRVYIVANDTQRLGKPIWKIDEEQGETWHKAEVPIPVDEIHNLDRFHIIIEGERNEFRGDAAIDDLSLTGCNSVAMTSSFQTSTESTVTNTFEMSTTSQLLPNVTIMPDQLLCTFDKEGFCAWQHDDTGDFEWTVIRGPTESLGTGPSSDHTSGNGWYAYIESSSPRENGDKAILRSPTISSNFHVCLNFFYHMRGQSVGTLEVLTAAYGSYNFHTKWSVEGQQSVNGTDWKSAAIDIFESFNYDIIIQGVRGDNFYSDIAIDDIIVTSSPCPTQSTTTTSSTDGSIRETTSSQEISSSFSHVDCDFDEHHLCDWQQLTDDEFDFTVSLNGNTPSPETGPESDHTGGGEFAYIESSNPQRPSHTASIESPFFSATSPTCFTFWYQMYGSQIGNMSVYQVFYQNQSGIASQISRKELWSSATSTSRDWNELQLNLAGSDMSSIQIEAVVGQGWRGDIAIDDIVMKDGECAIFNCTFQTGTCGWKQEALKDDFNWTRTLGKTPSGETGPVADHTHKNDNGYYLFIETSNPRVFGDKARLISPTVVLGTNSRKCLRFWYHSYGIEIGTLNVFKRYQDDSSSYRNSPALWYQTENEGDQWLYAKINIEDTSSYQIVIEGVRGHGFRGDLAIDDVTISDGECETCCGSSVFQCGNYYCIPAEKRCDGIDDCGDESDESFCEACGQSVINPLTSSDFGNIIDDIRISTKPISSHGLRYGNTRGILIDVDQLSLIQHRGNAGQRINPGSNVDEELAAELQAAQRVPEIIKFRKKRSFLSSVSNMKTSTQQEVETSTTYSSQTENKTEKQSSLMATLTTSAEESTEASNTPKLYKTTSIPNSKTFEKEQEEKESNNEKQIDERKITPAERFGSTPIKLVHRGAEKISSYQWFRIWRTLKRDEEEEEEEEESETEEEENEKPAAKRAKRSAILRIVGGDVAVAHSWPWHGAYYITDSFTDTHYLCGATLIAPYWAVTAAHCALLGNQHTVVFGDHDLFVDEGTEQNMIVDAVFVNKLYQFPNNLGGDIGLIKMKYPVRTTAAVQPACLPSLEKCEFSPGYVCGITGWGRVRSPANEASLERTLRQGEVPIVREDVCNATYLANIQSSMFCAGGTGSNTCRGDSGGPLICVENDTSYLVGITSWGDDDCSPDVPGVYTKIRSFLEWISRIRSQTDTC